MATYFFMTVKEGAKGRLRPLPFQKGPDGKSLIPALNTQGYMDMRTSYPLGTVFASASVRMTTGGATPFYVADGIYPVSVPQSGLQSPSHEPTEEMRRDWDTYVAEHGNPAQEGDGQAAPVPTGRTLTPLEKARLNPALARPTVEADGFWVPDTTWWPLVMNLLNKENTLFTGPAGTGKTEITQLAARRLGLRCHVYDMGSMYDPISELLGVHRISDGGTSVFEYAQFTRDIQEECVIVLDELSRATPAVNNLLLPVLDSRRELPVEMAGLSDARRIKVHPGCRFVATANVGVEFTGVQGEMDRALVDRFDIMETDYMPADAEQDMLAKRYRIGKADAANIVSAANTVRSLARKEEIQRSVSTRETIRCARKVHDGFSAKEALEMVFLPLFTGTKADGERAVVWNAILSH